MKCEKRKKFVLAYTSSPGSLTARVKCEMLEGHEGDHEATHRFEDGSKVTYAWHQGNEQEEESEVKKEDKK